MTQELRIERHAELDLQSRAFACEQWKLHNAERQESFERQPFVLPARTENGNVEGTATGWTGMTVAYLSELIVDREHRRHGVGTRLLSAPD